MTTLTAKQELFAQKYIELDDATEAHLQVYGGEMSHNNRKKEASLIKGNPLVEERIKELRNMAAVLHLITKEGQAAKLEALYEEARLEKQYASAISAVMGQSKHYGLLVDKAEVSGKDGAPIFATITIEPVSPKNDS